MITHSAVINGIRVDARYSARAADELFIPLLRRAAKLRDAKGNRVLVMLAAPPGAGKSTLLSFLHALSRSRADLRPVQTIGMDGFHRRQEYLKTHFAVRDGQEIPLVNIKGAPVTFDLDKLSDRVRAVARGGDCPWPVYDRLLHNPVENALTVDGDIVLLEGNYLLLDEPGWRDLSALADLTVFVRADEDFLRARLIDRRIRTGVDGPAAARFVDYSDMPNVRLCLQKALPADLTWTLDRDGDYRPAD